MKILIICDVECMSADLYFMLMFVLYFHFIRLSLSRIDVFKYNYVSWLNVFTPP